MKYVTLFFRMIRYRSALILVISMLLGIAWHNGLVSISISMFFGALALFSTYACATCVNDIADFKIDQINLKGHIDRPLITGKAVRRDLIIIAIAASCISLIFGILINLNAILVIFLILLMNVFYSLPPLKISHSAELTPFFLVIGYVILPYFLGVIIAGSYPGIVDTLFLSALYFLFLARISLKDFRDREGDFKNKKPTILLKYGKLATCILSIVSVIVGSVLMIVVFRGELLISTIIFIYLLAILFIEFRLLRSNDIFIELISIGFGARLGNGLLFTILGIIVLNRSNAELISKIVFSFSLILIYLFNFLDFWNFPETYKFGKKVNKYEATR